VRGNTIAEHPELRSQVEAYLLDLQSPEHTSRRIQKYHKTLPYVSGVTIRTYIRSIYGRKIEAKRKKIYTRKRGKKRFVTPITDKRMIDQRPKYIKERKRIGDAEGDFIVSGREGEGYLFVGADRKSRAPFLEKIHPVSIPNVERAIGRIMKRFPELKTFTFDNNLLFIHHKRLEKKFKIRVYFCHKHSPWEKGFVENRNKIIRQFIPKGSDISQYSRYYIQKLEDFLQRRIMKVLDYAMPIEILTQARKRKQKR
jgi:IS30 family transposase